MSRSQSVSFLQPRYTQVDGPVLLILTASESSRRSPSASAWEDGRLRENPPFLIGSHSVVSVASAYQLTTPILGEKSRSEAGAVLQVK